MAPSWIIRSNCARLTHCWRMSCSSCSRSGASPARSDPGRFPAGTPTSAGRWGSGTPRLGGTHLPGRGRSGRNRVCPRPHRPHRSRRAGGCGPRGASSIGSGRRCGTTLARSSFRWGVCLSGCPSVSVNEFVPVADDDAVGNFEDAVVLVVEADLKIRVDGPRRTGVRDGSNLHWRSGQKFTISELGGNAELGAGSVVEFLDL